MMCFVLRCEKRDPRSDPIRLEIFGNRRYDARISPAGRDLSPDLGQKDRRQSDRRVASESCPGRRETPSFRDRDGIGRHRECCGGEAEFDIGPTIPTFGSESASATS
jgi:hypothetical protein